MYTIIHFLYIRISWPNKILGPGPSHVMAGLNHWTAYKKNTSFDVLVVPRCWVSALDRLRESPISENAPVIRGRFGDVFFGDFEVESEIKDPWDWQNFPTFKLFFYGIWGFPKMVGFPPKSSILIGVFHYKPSNFGVPLFLETPISLGIHHGNPKMTFIFRGYKL